MFFKCPVLLKALFELFLTFLFQLQSSDAPIGKRDDCGLVRG